MCTTIVETGLDISNANTLIVERADTFGLSQLHQLRGRVGRSRERGYAYFLYPPEVPLTETAYDRLATIAQNNELGAGMAVAMKDLEIRGAGNVLGAEQSGHVAGVGFDLYVRLVGEAVEAYRAVVDGETVAAVEEPKDVRIDLPVDAHLPPDYIGSDRLRLEGYRRLAAAADDAGIASVVEELVDRYGPLPEPARAAGRAGPIAVAVPPVRRHRDQLGLGVDGAPRRRCRCWTLSNFGSSGCTQVPPTGRPPRRSRCPSRATGAGIGAPRIRDLELVRVVAGLLLALNGKPQTDVDITNIGGVAR